MRTRDRITALCLCVAATACAPGTLSGDSAPGRRMASLTGGTDAATDQFPSTVYITVGPGFVGGCGAVKVGPRHLLTAAHCVWSAARGEYRLAPGARMAVSNATLVDTASGIGEVVTVANVVAHPSWIASVMENGDVARAPIPADVGVIELVSGLDDIPTATINVQRVAPGTPVTLQGHGCEMGLSGPQPGALRQLKFGRAAVDAPEHALDPARVFPWDGQAPTPDIADVYFFTPGAWMDGGEASLCFGDSGGPVYASIDGALQVVGVNAYYSFSHESHADGGVSVSNWHARVDGAGRSDVQAFLTAAGVPLGADPLPETGSDCGAPCDTGAPCARGEIVCDAGVRRCEIAGPAASGVVCRAAEGDCDLEDRCNGASMECPELAKLEGAPCADGICDGTGMCVDPPPYTRPSAPETCDGTDEDDDGIVDDGCPAGPTEVTGSVRLTSLLGDDVTNGDVFRLACPAGQVVIGAFGWEDDVSVRQIGFHCGRAVVRTDATRTPHRHSVELVRGADIGPVGRTPNASSDATEFDWTCEDAAMRRLRAYVADTGTWVQFLSMACNPMDVSGSVGDFDIDERTTVTRSRGVGGLTGATFDGESECPAGHFASEVRGHTLLTGRLENIQLACRRVVPTLR